MTAPIASPPDPNAAAAHPWHALAADEVIRLVASGRSGLSGAEAHRRLEATGPKRAGDEARRGAGRQLQPVSPGAVQLRRAALALPVGNPDTSGRTRFNPDLHRLRRLP